MDEAEPKGSSRPTRQKRRINLPLPSRSGSNLPATIAEESDATSDRTLDDLSRRIVSAPINEIPILIRARGAIIEQDELRRENDQLRAEKTRTFYSKIGFSIAAVLGGTALIVAGFGLPGFFLVGGAAAVYVPEYVKQAIGTQRAGDGDAA